ncbi:RNase A-like domain-containing protein, partial [Bacillus pseudomycoides]
MDLETFINVTYTILHLEETAQNMWHAFSSTMKRDIIDGDAVSRTQWTTYGLTQIGIGLILDKGLGKAGLVTKGAGGASTLSKGVTLIKDLKQAADILQSFKKDVSFAFSGGNIITKIPQSELNQAYYNFAKTKNATKGTDKVNPDVIRKVDHNILDRMESAGGHTLDKHVGKTNEELIKRAIQENVEAATSFTDKSTALKAIQENLRKNSDDIAKWLNESDTGRKIFDVSHKNPIGKGALEDKKQVIYNLTNSRVVLIRDSTNELGFRVLTGFPIVK